MDENSGIDVGDAALLCAVPAASVFLGSVVAFKVMAGEGRRFLSITQYFSAGILIAAIGTELLPKLIKSSPGAASTLAIMVGFFLGVALMLGIEHCMEGSEEEEGEQSLLPSGRPGDPREEARVKIPAINAWRSEDVRRQRSFVSASAAASMLRKAVSAKLHGKVAPLPYGAIMPIFVDSWMDGLLIGVVLTASTTAGKIMAMATTIQMGFVGVALGALLKACGLKRWPVAALAPAVLVTGGVAGVVLAGILAEHPGMFTGVVAFGASALLFLVTHELLNEARVNIGEDEDWTLSVWFFIGFFFIVLAERMFSGL